MDEWVWKFIGWIYTNYGRTGCVVAWLIMVTLITLFFVLMNRLPEQKTENITE